MAPSRIDRPPGMPPSIARNPEESGEPTATNRSNAVGASAPSVVDRLERPPHSPSLSGLPSPTTSPTNLARVEGTMHTPPVVLSPVDLMGQLEQCELAVKIPLRSTADLGGWISVREGTDASLTLAIKDGEIDLKKTLFEIKDKEGNDYTLDGPLWLDPDKVYIDDQGQLRAKLPCFPDPNITKQLLGPDADRVPKDPKEFLQRVTQGNNVDLQIIDKIKVGDTPEPCETETSGVGEPGTLDSVVDLEGLNFDFSGKLKPGPIKLGSGITMNLQEGGELQASGTMQDMDVVIDTPLKSMALSESGTKITGGNGRAKMNVNFKRESSDQHAPCAIKLGFDVLELNKFNLTTPAVDGTQHHLKIDHLDIQETNGQPLLELSSDAAGESHMRLELDKVILDDISGELIVKDTHGELVELGLGRPAGEMSAPMNIETTVVLDTGLKEFQVVARADALKASVGKLGLVETSNFDLTLESGTLTGSGAINVTQTEHDSHLRVIADEGTAWTIETDLHDAHIGVATDQAKVVADLSTDTRGTITLRELDISPNSTPVFDASASFTVALDHLSIPFGQGETIDLKAGTTGSLEIREMAWSQGDVSPTVDAELRLNVGTDTLLKPGDVPGLEGAKVELDVDTGDSILVLNAKLDKSGQLTLDCGISLRNVEIKTDLRRGDSDVIPMATLPADALGAVEYKPVLPMRSLEPRPDLLRIPAATPISAPKLNPISINPSDTFGVLNRAEVSVDIPIDALDNLRIVNHDGTSVVSRLGIGDTVGESVTVNATRGSGPIRAELALDDGNLSAGTSKLVIDPPLSLDIWAKYDLPGPLAPETTIGAVVHALEVRTDEETGEAYLWPEVDLSGLLPQVAEGIGLGHTVRTIIGDKLGEAVIGSSRFPSNLQGFLGQLQGQVKVLGEPIIIDPRASVETQISPANPTDTQDPALAALLSKIRFDETDLSVRNAELNDTIIPLGDGQRLHFAPGSQLKVEGGLNDFRVVGQARLGESRLGGPELGLDIGDGEASIDMRVYRDENGDAHFDLTVSELNANNVAFETRVGDLTTQLGVESLQNGKIQMGYGGDRDARFELDLPGVAASITSRGSLRVDEYGGEIDLSGSLEGNLSIRNGQIEGDVQNLRLTANGTGASQGGPSENEEANWHSISLAQPAYEVTQPGS